MCAPLRYLILLLISLVACKSVRPDTHTGPVLDASHNVAAALYYPRVRPDQPFPRQTLVFVRHFYYFSRPTQWTIVSSGDTSPVTRFEQTAVYLLRLVSNAAPTVVRLLEIPGPQTEGVMEPQMHLAMAAPTIVDEDGYPVRRNTTGSAVVYVENGPLYGVISVDIPDTVVNAEQLPRLLVAGRVRAAALSPEGTVIAYVDHTGQLFITTSTGSSSVPVFDLRSALGPVSISAIQWDADVGDRVLIRLDRGVGPEVWAVLLSGHQLIPMNLDPETVKEPGSDRLPDVDQLTRGIGPQGWRVPDPRGFSP